MNCMFVGLHDDTSAMETQRARDVNDSGEDEEPEERVKKTRKPRQDALMRKALLTAEQQAFTFLPTVKIKTDFR